jgi:tetratricopeptide (TPR) repeat protein
VFGWLTADDPDERPSSAREALARLERGEPELEQPTTQAFTPEPSRSEPPSPPPAMPVRSTSHRGRWGAVAALLAIVAAVVVVALVALGGDEEQQPNRRSQQQAQAEGGASNQKAAQEQEAPAEASAKPEETAETPEESAEGEPAAASTSAPEEADPAGGSTLNEQGYELIQAGEYDAAVPVLEEAVASFPEGSEDLAYAYALFNLGNALRLSGRPEEAIPVLERRLEIPNQTGTVEEELEAARAEAG